MRTTTFLMFALLVISGCATSRTDGGARVRPMSGGNPYQDNTALSSGIPLNDGATTDPNNVNAYYGTNNDSQVQFPPYSYDQTTGSPNNAVSDPYNQPAPPSVEGTQRYQPSNTAVAATQQPSPTYNQPAQPDLGQQTNPNQSNAVQALLNEANSAVKSNQLEKAASALNRAVRLEPNNPSIWYDLAQIRLHQGKYEQAEELATKSNVFATGNQDLVNKNWRIISSARKAKGDNAGADAAMRNIR